MDVKTIDIFFTSSVLCWFLLKTNNAVYLRPPPATADLPDPEDDGNHNPRGANDFREVANKLPADSTGEDGRGLPDGSSLLLLDKQLRKMPRFEWRKLRVIPEKLPVMGWC